MHQLLTSNISEASVTNGTEPQRFSTPFRRISSPVNISKSQARILIVDDEAANVEFLTDILSSTAP